MDVLIELGFTDPVPALDTPAVAAQLQQGFWGGAQAGVAPKGALGESIQVRGVKELGVTDAAGRDFHDPAGADSGLGDVRMGLFRPQRPGDVTAVADLVIACHKRDVPPALELAADLAVQGLLICYSFGEECVHGRQEDIGPLLLEPPKKGAGYGARPTGGERPPNPARRSTATAPLARGFHRLNSRPGFSRQASA